MKLSLLKILICLLVLPLLVGCGVMKKLDSSKGETLVVKNKITVTDPHHLADRPEFMYTFSTMFKQPVNRKWLWMFRTPVWAYYKYDGDSSKFAKWAMKKVAEKPTIFTDELTERTAKNFENYMKQRGYFNAECVYDVRTKGKKTKVKYELTVGKRYSIDSIHFFSRDSAIEDILKLTHPNSLLHSGAPLDGQVFDAEKLRISSELKNRGYAYFIPNFVEFTGDSTDRKTKVSVEVLPFSDTSFHKKYHIGKVAVFTSLVPDLTSVRRDTTMEGIYFASAEPRFWVKPKLLLQAISIRPGDWFRQADFDNTYKKLSAMGVFRFVAIKPSPDPNDPQRLDVTITMAPLKRLDFGWDADFNYSNSFVSNNLLGVAGNLSLRNRNLLRGAENLQTTLGYAIQFDPTTPDRFFNSQEFKLQSDLRTPRFSDKFRFWRNLERLPVGISSDFYKRSRTDGESRFSLSFNYSDLFDYYGYRVAHAALGFDVKALPEKTWSFDHIGIDVLLPDTAGRKFWPRLDSIEFIRRSFGKQLFTGFLLRSYTYNYFGNPNRFGEQWNFRLGMEISGAEQFVAHAVYSGITKTYRPWQIGELDFAKFLKVELSSTYTRTFRQGLQAALRIGAGAAGAFGDTESTPYVKQLFIGGPNSLRAWRVRELGPGAFVDPALATAQPPFYQTGDFLFEFNAELRFDLFWWFKGAVFLDGGNIWTLRTEKERPGAALHLGSYRNIALGTGAGLRADFDYFIFRLDLGLKLRRPFETAAMPGYWLLDDYKSLGFKQISNWNIAVGYPF